MIRQPFIIALIGQVGSGKTHIARLLAEKLDAAHVNTDAIRVTLRRRGEPMSRAIALAHRLQERLLRQGKSLILDHDMVNPMRRRELRTRLRPCGAHIYFMQIVTPERLILARLRRKRYTRADLFRNPAEAIRVYYFRKAFRKKFLAKSFTPDFVIDNSEPLGPQISEIVEAIRARSSIG